MLKKKHRNAIGLLSLCWLVAWFYYRRASREIHPLHPDVGHVNERRVHYQELLAGGRGHDQ